MANLDAISTNMKKEVGVMAMSLNIILPHGETIDVGDETRVQAVFQGGRADPDSLQLYCKIGGHSEQRMDDEQHGNMVTAMLAVQTAGTVIVLRAHSATKQASDDTKTVTVA